MNMKKSILYSIPAIGILPAYMLYKAHHDHIVYHDIHDRRLPGDLNEISIFFIADLHRRLISGQTLAILKEKSYDFILIGGDLIENGVRLGKVRKNLARLKQLDAPVYFVWGNNDIVYGKEKIRKCLLQYGVHILEDRNERIKIANQDIILTGLGYYEQYQPQLEELFLEYPGEYRITLAHTPFIFDSLMTKQKKAIDVFLAGHTHGGQIRLERHGIYPRGGHRYEGNTHILVTEGYGYRLIPFRLGTDAQCHVITITKDNLK